MNPKISDLWQEHTSVKFPRGYGGTEIEGILLADLDGTAAGCILTFPDNDGALDLWRTAILGLCYRNLAVVMNKLEGEAKGYFARLETLSQLVLRDILLREKRTSK